MGTACRRDSLGEAVELEALTHYCTEPAAKGRARNDPVESAKLYRALGMRILKAGKNKYYKYYEAALGHFKKAGDMDCGAGQAAEWEAVIETMRTAHSRKRGFLSALEQRLCGKSQRSPSFAQDARALWNRLTS
jgi:uncharacterized Zn finger protein